jgi:hypothetical protein
MAKCDIYDVENIAIMVDGVEFSDALDGESVKVSTEELRSTRYSLKGKPLITNNPKAKHSTFTFTILKNHALNDLLHRLDCFSLVLVDMNTNISYAANKAYVMKAPDDEFGKNEQGEWEVLGTYVKRTSLGGL